MQENICTECGGKLFYVNRVVKMSDEENNNDFAELDMYQCEDCRRLCYK
jgi:uncharacterized protein with PIN domain